MSRVLFFDGDCAFCSAAVRFVSRLDRRGLIFYAPLQGELARRHGLSSHAEAAGGTMVLLREADGVLFRRSDAVIELARALGGPWRLAGLAVFIPRRWRDALYQLMADHRRGLFAVRPDCVVPDAAFRKRLRE